MPIIENNINTIIIVSGKKRVGKDTFAINFIRNGYQRIAFADQLKKDYKDFMVNIMKADRHLIDCHGFQKDKGTGFFRGGEEITNREGMQWYGQIIKDFFNEYYWVDIVCNIIKQTNKNFIITDARFPFEINRVVESLSHDFRIIKVRIKRNTGLIDNHISETALDNTSDNDFTYVIDNNSSLENFHHTSYSILDEISKKV